MMQIHFLLLSADEELHKVSEIPVSVVYLAVVSAPAMVTWYGCMAPFFLQTDLQKSKM